MDGPFLYSGLSRAVALLALLSFLCLTEEAATPEHVEKQCRGNKACALAATTKAAIHPHEGCLVCQEFSVPWIPVPVNMSIAQALTANDSDCGLNIDMGFTTNVTAYFKSEGTLPDWLEDTNLGLSHKRTGCDTDGPRYKPNFARMTVSVVPPIDPLWCLCSDGTDGPNLGTTTCEINIRVHGETGTGVTICNSTDCLRVRREGRSLLTGTATSGPVSWVCGSTAYTRLPRIFRANATKPSLFAWSGCCTPALVLPQVHTYTSTASRNRSKRSVGSFYNGYTLADPWTTPGATVGWSVFLGGGTTATLNKINGLAWQMLVLANETEKALALVTAELKAVRQAVLQNRVALDLVFSKEGGLCKVLNTSCCFSLPDYTDNITDLIQHMKDSIAPPPMVEDWFSWLTSMFGPWGHWIISVMLPMIIIGLIILMCVPCIFSLCSSLLLRSVTLQQAQLDDDDPWNEFETLELENMFAEK